jgi:hypothetical protein
MAVVWRATSSRRTSGGPLAAPRAAWGAAAVGLKCAAAPQLPRGGLGVQDPRVRVHTIRRQSYYAQGGNM